MQYKIPVQVENVDKVIGPFSLAGLFIFMAFCAVAYFIFDTIQSKAPEAKVIGIIIALTIVAFGFFVTTVKIHEMNFVHFMLSFIRFKINLRDRYWQQGTDSFQPIDIGIVTSSEAKEEKIVDFATKQEQIRELNEKISKI